jgi:hypothetical protein
MLLLMLGKRDNSRTQNGTLRTGSLISCEGVLLTLNLSMADSVLCATVLMTSTALKGNFP